MGGPVDGAPPPSSGGPVERGGHGLFHRHHDEDAVPRSTERLPDPTPDDVVASDRHDIVEYDLSEWRQEQVAALVEQLELEHVTHEWVGRHLEVPGADEEQVDELVDLFDEAFSRGPDDVEYEFPDWTPQQRQQLVERILALEVGCTWDGNLLAVGAADEAAVDAEVLKIDPTFPVTDTGEDEEEPPSSGWGGVVAEIAAEVILGPWGH